MNYHYRFVASIVLGLAIAGCTAKPELTKPVLHVVGVYEGTAPPGSDDRPWWAMCNDDESGKNDENDGSSTLRRRPVPAPSADCHAKYAGKHLEKEVAVSVSDDTRPIVLALTAYDKTHWKISLKNGVQLTKVILGGYHAQRVSGIPSETPIETYTHDPSPCDRCQQGANYFYSYKTPPQELKKITGLEVTTFQGKYRGSEFAIVPGMNPVDVK